MEHKFHLVVVYNYDPLYPEKGGGRRYAHNLIKELSELGIPITLFGIEKSNQKTYSNLKCCKIITISRKGFIVKDPGQWAIYLSKLLLKTPLYKNKINKRVTIIHSHRTYFLLPFILFYPKVPKVATLHMKPLEFVRVEYPQYFKIVDKIHKIIDSFCISHIDAAIAISKDIKIAYLERYSQLQGKITLIEGSGVDTEKFRPLSKQERNKLRKAYRIPPNSMVILFAGRITKIKNLPLLLRAFKVVLNNEPLARLVIAGNGPELTRLESLAESLNISQEVIFLGEVPPERMPEVYNIADVFAITSFSEASPNVVREALACGVPVVSVDVGDVRQVINHPLIGRIVTSYEPDEFAQALIEMLKVKEKKEKIIKKLARKKALEYSIKKIAEKYCNIYKDLAGDIR